MISMSLRSRSPKYAYRRLHLLNQNSWRFWVLTNGFPSHRGRVSTSQVFEVIKETRVSYLARELLV